MYLCLCVYVLAYVHACASACVHACERACGRPCVFKCLCISCNFENASLFSLGVKIDHIWFHNDTLMDPPYYFVPNAHRSYGGKLMSLMNVNAGNSGKYECWAQRDGVGGSGIDFTVIVAGEKNQTRHCRIRKKKTISPPGGERANFPGISHSDFPRLRKYRLDCKLALVGIIPIKFSSLRASLRLNGSKSSELSLVAACL